MAFENNEYNLENRLGEATRGLECQEPCYVNIKRTRRRLFVRAVLREQSEQQRMMGDIYDPKAIARISSSRSIWSKNAALLEALRDEKCAKEHQRARTKLLATNKTWLVQ